MTNFRLLILMCLCPSLAAELETSSILVGFNVQQGQWINPPDEFAAGIHADFDMELDLEKHNGRVLSARIDLDDDGTPEYLVQNTSICGNGGCPYAIFDGQAKRFLGTVLGSDTGYYERDQMAWR